MTGQSYPAHPQPPGLKSLGAKGHPQRLLQCIAVAAAKLLQSCPTLCDPIDSSPPGSAVPGILQASVLHE